MKERIKRDHTGVTLERENGELIHKIPWELPRLAAELIAQPNLDAGHRKLLQVYLLGRPQPEYFPVHSEWQTVHLNPPERGSRIIYAQPKRDEPNAVVVRWSRHKGHRSWLVDGIREACETATSEMCERVKEYPSGFAQPFTWTDAERIMLAGGECESTHPEIPASYARCRITKEGAKQAFFDGEWRPDGESHKWEYLDWRPCPAPAQYTWEQALGTMCQGGEAIRVCLDDGTRERCRITIIDGVRRFQVHKADGWRDSRSADTWHFYHWEPVPSRYTWEQAEAGMRRGEIWVATHKHWLEPMQFTWGDTGVLVLNEDDEWSEFLGTVSLSECEWRPWKAGES